MSILMIAEENEAQVQRALFLSVLASVEKKTDIILCSTDNNTK